MYARAQVRTLAVDHAAVHDPGDDAATVVVRLQRDALKHKQHATVSQQAISYSHVLVHEVVCT